MENKYDHLCAGWEKPPFDKGDRPPYDKDKFHHDHHVAYDPIGELYKRINEEAVTRHNEDKNLNSIIHTLYGKIDDFRNVDIKELNQRLDNAIKKIPDMENIITEGKLRHALCNYYNKYEVTTAFATVPVRDHDIKKVAHVKLKKYLTNNE